MKLGAANNHIIELQGESFATNEQVRQLAACNVELVGDHNKEMHHSVRCVKKELIAKYHEALALFKDKFEKKNVEHGLEVKIQEVVANLELLEDVMENEIDDDEIL